MNVETLRNLDNFRGTAILVRRGEEFFAVSYIADAFLTAPETLAFPCTEDGEVTSWGEVAGGRGMTPADVIAQLEDGTDYRESWDELDAGPPELEA